MNYVYDVVDVKEIKQNQEKRLAAIAKLFSDKVNAKSTMFIDKETLTEDDMLEEGE